MQAVISSIFTKAEDWGYWEGRNPARRTTLGRKKPKREKRILTDEQLALLLAAVPEHVRLMIETAVSTGMRISEILGLRWRYVDLTLGVIKIEERFYRGETGEPKSEKARRVLPLGLLKDRYKQHRPANAVLDAYVFEAWGEPLDDRSILRGVIRPAARRLGFYFEGFGWHSFRRQNITLLQEEGATAFEAMAQAGHSRPSMTGEYTIVGFERREQAVRRVQERLQLGRPPVSLGVN
jgi:integrase